jgi:peptidoglycan/LPS O-acetylase OafA/YrhL
MTDRLPVAAVATDQAPRKVHLAHLEGLRALAALTVYVNHAYAQTWERSGPEFDHPPLALRLFMVFGHLAVSVFIVLSGFCLALPVISGGDRLRGGTWDFFKRRARRILPPYYGQLALTLLLIATIIGKPTNTLWDVPIQVDWKAIVAHVLLVQDLFRTGRINYVLWSIAVEWHIYFLFPLFVWAVARFGIVRVALVALVLGFAARFLAEGTRYARPNPQYIGLFALGMFAAYVVRSDRPELAVYKNGRWWGWLALGLFGSLIGLCLYWGVPEAATRFHYLDLPAGFMAAAILVHSSLTPGALFSRVLNWRILTFIGTFSYSMYLLHAPLLQVIWQYVLNPLGLSLVQTFAALMTVGLGAILAFSYGFFKVCEEPFMRAPARAPALNAGASVSKAT